MFLNNPCLTNNLQFFETKRFSNKNFAKNKLSVFDKSFIPIQKLPEFIATNTGCGL